MERKQTNAKKILLGVIFLLWLLPLVQQLHPFAELRPLDGAVTYSPDDTLTWSSWFDGSYGRNKENYMNEQFGFRNFFVRSRNQIYFSMLKVPTAKGVVIGKDNFLYEEKYISSYTGQDFIGEDAMREKMRKLKFVSDTLKKLNIDLVLLFAPGKATYYPEYIPDHYFKNADTVNTNYKWGSRIAREMGLNFIDYNALFKSLKATTKYPLFPKTGIHWSYYASHFAFDTLTRYIEHLTEKRLLHYKYDKVEWSYDMRDVDEDIGRALNTLFQVKPMEMAYANVEYEPLTNQYRPKVITISDSFWGGIYYSGLASHVFKEPQYWYFYTQNWDYSPNITDPITYDLRSKIEENNIIILMTTESHVSDMGWGFIEQAYDLYTKGEDALKDRNKKLAVLRMTRWMRTEPKVMFETRDKAKKMHVSLDSMLDSEAFRLLGSYVPELPETFSPQKNLTNAIYNNSSLEKLFQERATKENRPLREVINEEVQNCFTKQKTITIKAANGKFLCADESRKSLVLANRDKASTWETFSLVTFGDGHCIFYSYAHLFLCADLQSHSEVSATREKIGEWELFTMEDLGNNEAAFKACDGKYLSLDEASMEIVAKGTTIGANERFKIINAQ